MGRSGPAAAPIGPTAPRLGEAAAAADAPPPAPPDSAPPSAAEAPPDLTAAVAEVPKLADGVHLSGDMDESAFVEPQWLVQRDGQFVQLTELLYRVAENVDGKRNLEEIAEAVGDAIDRDVTDDNIRQLIGEKLIPLGLVQTADGKSVRPPNAGRSLLQVNAKMAMIPEQTSQALGRVLSFLYWPPMLMVALAVAIAAQVWLYVTHGVGGSVHDVLYRPQLLLAILAVIVVATGFHELGHAAALVYGGGRVRGMGAGMYLIYPAFYTDVTDNYRLGRWARVRTDLGGIYFNLIFAAGTVGLYLLTGWEFLLASVILLNIQTVQQLLPFVRLDGYWLLADITGIPDFFTHMGGFLRSVLPIKAWRGPKLPEMKWWGKAVFAGYILLVIPLLAFIVFLAIKSFPRLAATTWDSFQQQLGQVSSAFVGGDALGVVGTAAGIVLLALPALGLAYMFWALGKGLVVRLWGWSRGDVRKRVLAMAAVAATALLLGVLWTPYVPMVGGAGPLYGASGDWRPIAADERVTIREVLAGEVRYVRPTPEPALSPTPAQTITPLGAATAVAPTPTEGAARTTAAATPTREAASPTPNATLRAVVPTTTGAAEATVPARATFAAPSATTSTGTGAAGSAALQPTAAASTATPVPAAPPPSNAPAPTNTTAPAASTGGSTAPAPATSTPGSGTSAPVSATSTPAPAGSTAASTPGAGTPTPTATAATRSGAATGSASTATGTPTR